MPYRVKNFILSVAATAIAFFLLSFAWGIKSSRFSKIEGNRSFYYDLSSQAEIKKELSWVDFSKAKGESVVFFCDTEKILPWLLEEYDGKILFTEETEGSTSYYCFTKNWTDGVWLNGYFVNLHIAVGKDTCSVGAPLIFGSF